ncbi:MAG: sodium:solute symporter family transporter, partial [Terriglobia bacterium]
LSPLDASIICAYFVLVLGVGYYLKGKIRTSSDFLLTNRSLSHWITGIAFMSANLGSLEVMGHIANGAKYGMRTNHWYWIGAIPAMVFFGLFMVRYYYATGVRSVPEYLRRRFDHRAHLLNSLSFAVVTVLMSGINMFAFAVVFNSMLGWSFTSSVLLSASVVLIYTFWGGLASSIYNEVLQFVLIIAGFLPLTFIGLREVGGWKGLTSKLPEQYLHTWKGMGGPHDPLGVSWWVMVIGIGLTAAPAYWCTDFLLVQRALAAKNLDSARKTPLVAAIPKMLFPAIVTLLGMIALTVAPGIVTKDYNLALPLLMGRYYHSGMLGLGLTALLASFMSGMAGNITAFNTVFTYDLYQTYLVKGKSDGHYLRVAKWATIWGTLLSAGSAYIVLNFNDLMDYMQLIGILFVSPFFIIFLLGMFWKRPSATAGFYGMVAGISGCFLEYVLYRFHVLHFATPMASNIWTAVWGLVGGLVVMVLLTLLTKPPDESRLQGLVYAYAARSDAPQVWYQTPEFYAVIVVALFIYLNVKFF